MPQLASFMPYICAPVSGVLQVDPTIKLTLQPSMLSTTFLPECNLGLFTISPIPKDTIILPQFGEQEAPFNDAMVDLTNLIKARTSREMYQAWKEMQTNYYDLPRIQERVNVRMVVDSRGRMFYQTMKDIPGNTELLRIYGFTSWILIVLELLTKRNLAGYAQLVLDLERTERGDPIFPRIQIMAETLRRFYIGPLGSGRSPQDAPASAGPLGSGRSPQDAPASAGPYLTDKIDLERYDRENDSDEKMGSELTTKYRVVERGAIYQIEG